jgi:ABC-type sugar transport system permease subunit
VSATSFGLLLVAPAALLLLLIVVYPVLESLYLALTNTNPLTGAQRFVGLANFSKVLASSGFWDATRLTLYYVLCVTVLGTAVALGMALLLHEKFFGRAILMAAVVLPWSLSTYAAGVVWRYVYSPQYGLLAAIAQHIGVEPVDVLARYSLIPGLALVHAWQFAPLGTYFLLASLQAIPEDLYKLARVDGMGMLRRFVTITVPYIQLPLAIYLVLIGGQAANVFDLIYFLTSGGPGTSSRTLTYDTYVETFTNQNFGYGAAMSWMLLVLVTGLTVAYFLIAMAPKQQGAAS